MKFLTNSASLITPVNQDANDENGRVFGYALNQKRAMNKLLKGANWANNLDVEVKDGCVNFRFCNGSFYEIILPMLKIWQEKVNEVIKIDETGIKVIEVIKGTENTNKHVDTKLIVMINDDRLVIHVYNGTQNVMIQGRNYSKHALNFFEPFFRQQIEISIDTISKVNNDIKNWLGPKKAINRKPFDCPQCKVKATTHGDLKIHMKKCHTKPSIESPKKRKAIKRSDDSDEKMKAMVPKLTDNLSSQGGSVEKAEPQKAIEFKKVVSFMPGVQDLLICNICDYDTTEQEDLDDHLTSIHGHTMMTEN